MGKSALAVTIFRFGFVKTLPAAFHPSVRQVRALAGIGIVGCSRRTLIEGHHDVGPDGALNVHHLFGGKEMLTAVNVRTKFATLVAQFSNAGQRKHLKAAAVGKHRAVETIELV